ncbi:ketopantoate reductase family protein [Ramlibacter algicola]|uniref:2-dehydropantoate 2-reductase n=1 Tax=Ramlibacter algicola TaxID=2795217 RepID=A0A934Q2M3_9BURK|nr:2-dehydropantoate 2-reductase [Ramlibacter algicola]MBK0393452.1 2-dehydropantoate 2-reductase [Ramlibacter algicola]
MTQPLHPVVVVGAGAVGCFFGGMLARAGHPVVLVGRPQHVDAIERHGLRMEARDFDEHVRLRATTDIAAVAQAQVVLFCVKSGDTESAGAQLKPHLRPEALVLCLQNGVDNADRLRTVLPPRQVAAAVVYVATEMAGPGHLKHHGRGDLVIEPVTRSEEVAQLFAQARVPVEISSNVRGALWAKLVVNCAYNAVSAIAQRPYGENVRSPGIQQVMSDVVAECLLVAQAEGVEIPGDIDLAVRRIFETMPTQLSSTAQDLARGKPTEIDHLNGLVVRRGQALGIPTPVNRTLWALVKLLEGKQQRAG